MRYKLYTFLTLFGLLVGSTAFALPTTTYLYSNTYPNSSTRYSFGTSTLFWNDITTRVLCLSGDSCRTTWPTGGGGSGGVATGTTGQFPYYAVTGTTLAATSALFITPTGQVGIGTTTLGQNAFAVRPGENVTTTIGKLMIGGNENNIPQVGTVAAVSNPFGNKIRFTDDSVIIQYGSGGTDNLIFSRAGQATAWSINGNFYHFVPGFDNLINIGQADYQVKNIYFGTSITGGAGSLFSGTNLSVTNATSSYLFATTGTLHVLRADGSDGLIIEANNGTDVGIFGAGNSSNSLLYGGLTINGLLTFSTANGTSVTSTNLSVSGLTTLATTTATFLALGGAVNNNNLLSLTPQKTYSSSQSTGGAFNIDNTNNAREAGVAFNNNNGTVARVGPLWRFENLSTTQSTGMVRINSLGTGGGDYDIRIDSPNPDIEFVDLDFAEPGATVEIDAGPVTGTSTVAGLRFNLRNDANSTFVNMGGFRRLKSNKGMFYLVPGTAGLSIGWQDDFLDWSLGPIQVNSNATSPSTIDLTNSIAVGTGTGGVNATSKFLGQFAWVSRDSSFTTPKMVAYIGAEGTEQYGADIDVGSQIKIYTGTINGTNPTEKAVFSDTGRLGIGTSTPLAVLTVSASSSNANAPILFEVASSTQTSLFRILGNGNVGINSSSPIDTLAVQGGLQVVGTGVTTTNLYASGVVNFANALGISSGGTNSSTVGSNGCVKYSNGTLISCTDVGTEGYLLMSMGAGKPVWANSTTLPYIPLPATPTQTSTYQMTAGGTTVLKPNATSTVSLNFNSPSSTNNNYGVIKMSNAFISKTLNCTLVASYLTGVTFTLSHSSSALITAASTSIGTFTTQSTSTGDIFAALANIPQDDYVRMKIEAVSTSPASMGYCALQGFKAKN